MGWTGPKSIRCYVDGEGSVTLYPVLYFVCTFCKDTESKTNIIKLTRNRGERVTSFKSFNRAIVSLSAFCWKMESCDNNGW